MSFHLHISPETRFLRLPGSFVLESGERLRGVEIAYRTWGELSPARDNAVVVCHALTGSADVDRWWAGLLGSGRALDPEVDFVVAANLLGSCYGTTGPLSPRAGAGQRSPDDSRWAGDFPAITVRDQVRLQQRLLDALAVERVRLVVGGSLGGMQALEWGLLDRGRVESLAVLSAPARHGPWGIALSELARRALLARSEVPRRALSGRRPAGGRTGSRAGHRHDELSQPPRLRAALRPRPPRRQLRGRRAISSTRGASSSSASTPTATSRCSARWTATIWRAAGGASRACCAGSTCRSSCSASSTDVLYPVAEQLELATLLPAAEYVELASAHGHDAFLIEQEAVDRILGEFRRAHGSGRAGGARGSRRPRRGGRGGRRRVSWRVLKFGGTSVGSPEALLAACGIVRRGGGGVACARGGLGARRRHLRDRAPARGGAGARSLLARRLSRPARAPSRAAGGGGARPRGGAGRRRRSIAGSSACAICCGRWSSWARPRRAPAPG